MLPALVLILATAAAGCLPSNDTPSASTGQIPEIEADAAGGPADAVSGDRIKGIVLDAREPIGDSTLAAVHDLGATHVTLVSFGFQESASTPVIRFSPDVRWYSESAHGARAIASTADALGLRIILKPQLWLRGGAWTADIDFATEDAWRRWESDYRDYLLHTARLADGIGADLIIIGTELATPVQERPVFWRSLITEIRGIFDGKLTYGANWYEDFEHVPFWDALDFVGVNAYFPIHEGSDPSLSELRRGWSQHAEKLQRVAVQVNRPVVFTEIGYRSVAYAAAEPWRWPSPDEVGAVEPDYELQANLFRSFFASVWSEPWFAGAVIWKMYPPERVLRDPTRYALDFTPQGKPAEHIIRAGFNGRFNANPESPLDANREGRFGADPDGRFEANRTD